MLGLLAFCFQPVANGEDWRNLVQPIGTIVAVETAATVNTRLGGNPPFEATTDVTTITTGAPQYFVRFYNPSDGTYPSNAVGSWLMRAATVRGLTPAQVRDVFALPALPTHMTMVLVPAGYKMYTGIAAPIAGWGSGGAQQSKLIGPPWVPSDNFFNRQPVMASVLSYRLVAPGGNTARIAAYLDGRIAPAYSDLETVYLNLDLLYTPEEAPRLRDALDQIGPARYDHLTANALYAGVQFNEAVDQRIGALAAKTTAAAGPALALTAGPAPYIAENRGNGRGPNAWASTIGGIQRAEASGFNSTSAGLTGGADTWVGQNLLVGVALGGLHSRLDWTRHGGDAAVVHGRLGAYAAWVPGPFFLQATLNGGVSQAEVNRPIVFSTIARNAAARPQTWESGGGLRIGARLPMEGLNLVPTAAIDYFHHHREHFSETGAGSLSLNMAAATSRTLRSHLAVHLSTDLSMADGMTIAPLARVGWAHERPLDNRSLVAGFEGQPDTFSVDGDAKGSDILTTAAGVTITSGKRFSLFAQVGVEWRQDRRDQNLATGLAYRF